MKVVSGQLPRKKTVHPVAKLIGYIDNDAKQAVVGGPCQGCLISLSIGRPGSLGDLRCTPEVLADLVLYLQIVRAFTGLYSHIFFPFL